MSSSQSEEKYSAFLPVLLVEMSVIVFFVWNVVGTVRFRANAVRLRDQQEALMTQAVEAASRGIVRQSYRLKLAPSICMPGPAPHFGRRPGIAPEGSPTRQRRGAAGSPPSGRRSSRPGDHPLPKARACLMIAADGISLAI